MTTKDTNGAGVEDAENESSRLSKIMAVTRSKLQLDFEALGESFSHMGVRGSGGEAAVASFLKDKLPSRIGVTTGQVIDCTGAMSRQLDVILYDQDRTPMLFTSPNNSDNLVPAEGVIAVIEVKTRLTKSLLKDVYRNCQSVKSLTRTAYLNRPPHVPSRVYGQDWIDVPIYYSLFAAKSDNMYAGAINDLQEGSPLHQRIDSVCYLDRGANLNVSIASYRDSPVFSSTPSPNSGLADVVSEQGLMYWYGALTSVVSQAEVRPIDIFAYMASEITISGTMPPGATAKSLTDSLIRDVADSFDIDPEILIRFQDQKSTTRDYYALLRSPGVDFSLDNDPEAEQIKASARELDYNTWMSRWKLQDDEVGLGGIRRRH